MAAHDILLVLRMQFLHVGDLWEGIAGMQTLHKQYQQELSLSAQAFARLHNLHHSCSSFHTAHAFAADGMS